MTKLMMAATHVVHDAPHCRVWEEMFVRGGYAAKHKLSSAVVRKADLELQASMQSAGHIVFTNDEFAAYCQGHENAPISNFLSPQGTCIKALHDQLNRVKNAADFTHELVLKCTGVDLKAHWQTHKHLKQTYKGFTGKVCTYMMSTRKEWFALIPDTFELKFNLEKFWVILEFTVIVMHMHPKDLTATILDDFHDATVQLQYLINAVFTTSPVQYTWKVYEHAICMHALSQLNGAGLLPIELASIPLEHGNKLIKRLLVHHTSQGGGRGNGDNTSDIKQALESLYAMRSECIQEHMPSSCTSYTCSRCGACPKSGHLCVERLGNRQDHFQYLTNSVRAPMPGLGDLSLRLITYPPHPHHPTDGLRRAGIRAQLGLAPDTAPPRRRVDRVLTHGRTLLDTLALNAQHATLPIPQVTRMTADTHHFQHTVWAHTQHAPQNVHAIPYPLQATAHAHAQPLLQAHTVWAHTQHAPQTVHAIPFPLQAATQAHAQPLLQAHTVWTHTQHAPQTHHAIPFPPQAVAHAHAQPLLQAHMHTGTSTSHVHHALAYPSTPVTMLSHLTPCSTLRRVVPRANMHILNGSFPANASPQLHRQLFSTFGDVQDHSA